MRQPAPYFSLVRTAWVPCIVSWDPGTGELRRVEGPRRFADYAQALEASWFLARQRPLDNK
jgi:hypothetical protein